MHSSGQSERDPCQCKSCYGVAKSSLSMNEQRVYSLSLSVCKHRAHRSSCMTACCADMQIFVDIVSGKGAPLSRKAEQGSMTLTAPEFANYKLEYSNVGHRSRHCLS